MRILILFAIICVGLPLLLVQCLESASGDEPLVTVSDAFSYPTIGTLRVGAAGMKMTNNGPDDAIISATSPVSDRVELHDHLHENGIMKMRKIDAVPLPKHKTVTMGPGGLHIMLFDLKQPLKAGDTFPITLELQSGKKMDVEVAVKPRG